MIFKRLPAAVESKPQDDISEQSIDEIVGYIEWLMSWYCRKPSMFLASIIVSRLESLQARERGGELVAAEWACHRLLRNWEYLVERNRVRLQS